LLMKIPKYDDGENDILLSVFNIDEEDLAFNRRGRLTKRQTDQIRFQFLARLVGTMIIMGLVLAVWLLSFRRFEVVMCCYLGFCVLLFIFLQLASTQTNKKLTEDLHHKQVKPFTGNVKKEEVKGHKAVVYYFHMDDKKWVVSGSVYRAVYEDQQYTFYFLPQTRRIVSAEIASENLPNGIIFPSLMHALGFTDADLKANREGYMTFEQRQHLAETQSMGSWLYGVAAALIAGIGVIFALNVFMFSSDNGREAIFAPSVCAGIIIAGFTLVVLWIPMHVLQQQTHLYRADLHKGLVQQIMGKVIRQVRLGELLGYDLVVAEERFSVSPYTYEQFTDGATYTLYYTPNSKTILSAELVSTV
jgi:hypothetical protein